MIWIMAGELNVAAAEPTCEVEFDWSTTEWYSPLMPGARASDACMPLRPPLLSQNDVDVSVSLASPVPAVKPPPGLGWKGMASVHSLNVGVPRRIAARSSWSGIDNRSVAGREAICDTESHGGDEQAVYAYAREDRLVARRGE
jgi:hypothetical protein